MARARDCSLVGLVFTSLLSFACSAPPGAEDDDGESVPEFFGAPPGPGLGAPAPGNGVMGGGVNSGANGAANPGANGGANPPGSEGVGNGANAPLDGANNSGADGNGSTGAVDPGAMAPVNSGAGGSAMTPTTPSPGGGVGGGSMQPGGNDPGGNDPGQGQGGAGNVPPGNNNPPVTPPSGVGCDGAIFCEDFDGIPVGPITAPVNGLRPDRTVNVIDEPGRGRVLQAVAGPTFQNKSGVFLDNFAPPNNSHFGRAFIRVAQFPVAPDHHWVIVEGRLTENDNGEKVRPVGGQFQRWAPGSDGPSAGDWTDHDGSQAATRAGTWECVEWQINGANGANDMTLWVNGVEVRPIERGNFRLPTVGVLWLGWVVYVGGEPGTYDVRFDDLVLSTERIGCD